MYALSHSLRTFADLATISKIPGIFAKIQDNLCIFWNKHPALFYGLSALISTCWALFNIPLSFFICCVLFLTIPILNKGKNIQGMHWRWLLALALGITNFYFAKHQHIIPDIKHPINGIADVKFSSVSLSKTPFGSIWNYKGTLLSFAQTGDSPRIARNVPISLSLPCSKYPERPLAANCYRLQGQLKQIHQAKYALRGLKATQWEPLKKEWTLADMRFDLKATLHQYIQRVIKDKQAASFLNGIATGEFDDFQLSYELGRFGLQHLMAVSGLHFSILASFAGFFLSLLFSRKIAAIFLVVMLSAYFLFLGASPSVVRAWIAVIIGLGGIFFNKRSIALNSLGISLLLISLWNPLWIAGIGFQFSFGITAAILLWASPCDSLFEKIFAKRTLSQVVDIGLADQHGYCLLMFFRSILALSLAVNLAALPLTLYHFHKFPVMSLVYNLFFPFMMSLSMLFLLIGCLFALLFPLLSNVIHTANESYTRFLLNFAVNLPQTFDITWNVSGLTKEFTLFFLLLLFIFGILFERHHEDALTGPFQL